MIINRCVEQGIYVTLILSLQKDHRPLRSTELSAILEVSDSYLKKILRKLVLSDIIVSAPGKDGGFQLARPIEEISVYDVYSALEGQECELKLSGIGSRIFIQEKFQHGEEKVRGIFEEANVAFLEKLRQLPLSDLSDYEYAKSGGVDFTERIAESN